MFRRINALFNVPKRRAAIIALLSALAAVLMLPLGPDFGSVVVLFLWLVLIYGGVWLYKYRRDKRLSEQAKTMQTEPPQIIESPTTSHRLYVPKKVED